MFASSQRPECMFVLRFAGDEYRPELIGTEFAHAILEKPRVAVRGKSVGAYPADGSFQWTRGVVALAALVVRERLSFVSGENNLRVLVGGNGSLAASLDDAVTKNTVWLLDMFGIDARGQPVIRRYLRRSNSGRKLPGPTAVALNDQFLPSAQIRIFVGDREVGEPEKLQQLLNNVERNST